MERNHFITKILLFYLGQLGQPQSKYFLPLYRNPTTVQENLLREPPEPTTEELQGFHLLRFVRPKLQLILKCKQYAYHKLPYRTIEEFSWISETPVIKSSLEINPKNVATCT